MKIKQRPEDFFVEELTDVQPAKEGDFALYRLEKRGWTTPDALQVIQRRWKLDLRRVSYGSLKDRHAHTVQYLTVWRGAERRLTHQRFHLEFLGRLREPYTSRDFRANRFRLTIRSLREADVENAIPMLEEMRGDGVPNYFDDQRFGSVGNGNEFVAKDLVLGDFEKALHLALTSHYEHDRAAQKQEKAILRANWGNWDACKTKLPRCHARNLVDFLLHHPGDFRGAVARLRPELRGLYLSAYQSFLWNCMLAKWLGDQLQPEQLLSVPLRLGPVPMHRKLAEPQRFALAALSLPLPTARGSIDPGDPRTLLMQGVLDREGLSREQLKIKGLREVFFSRGERAALCIPAALQFKTSEDEHNRERKKLLISFELPRGSYATLIVKRAFNFG